MIRAADLIERKRDGAEHSPEEISALVSGYASGEIPDYQMAAWCMAVYFRGLTGRETHALTEAFIQSGDTLDMGAALGRRVVDKHSTVGSGTRPRSRSARSSRRAGSVREDERPWTRPHGRDARQARVDPGLSRRAVHRGVHCQVREIGLAIVGTSADLVPADKTSTASGTSPRPSTSCR